MPNKIFWSLHKSQYQESRFKSTSPTWGDSLYALDPNPLVCKSLSHHDLHHLSEHSAVSPFGTKKSSFKLDMGYIHSKENKRRLWKKKKKWLFLKERAINIGLFP